MQDFFMALYIWSKSQDPASAQQFKMKCLSTYATDTSCMNNYWRNYLPVRAQQE